MCKVLYGTSAGLNAICCLSNGLALFSPTSQRKELVLFCTASNCCIFYAAKACNKAADCMNSCTTSKAIDEYLEKITKGL